MNLFKDCNQHAIRGTYSQVLSLRLVKQHIAISAYVLHMCIVISMLFMILGSVKVKVFTRSKQFRTSHFTQCRFPTKGCQVLYG